MEKTKKRRGILETWKRIISSERAFVKKNFWRTKTRLKPPIENKNKSIEKENHINPLQLNNFQANCDQIGIAYEDAELNSISEVPQTNVSQESPHKSFAKEGFSPLKRHPLFENYNWKDETRKILTRPFYELPIAIDLPRLAFHITLLDFSSTAKEREVLIPEYINVPGRPTLSDISKLNSEEMFTAFTSQNAFSVIRALIAISNCVSSGDGLGKILEEGWFKIIQNEKEIVSKHVYTKFIKSYIPVNHPLMTILHSINQAVIAPAVTELRMGICVNLNIKDAQPPFWQVVIRLYDNFCFVSHYRRQVNLSKYGAIDEDFEFIWELNLKFNRKLTELLDCSIHIYEISFGENTKDSVKYEVHRVFAHLMGDGI